MIFSVTASGAVSLLDTCNLRKFHVECGRPRPPDGDAAVVTASGLRFADQDTAWVEIACLKRMDPFAGSEERVRELEAMVQKAKPHGWVSENGEEIRAHVIWSDDR